MILSLSLEGSINITLSSFSMKYAFVSTKPKVKFEILIIVHHYYLNVFEQI